MVNKKICLLGEYGVGKTSLIRRFVHDIFSDDYITTIGVKVSDKILPPIEHKGKQHQFRFVIWDIAGSEDGLIKHENYWTGASAALIVADLCRPDTFIHANAILNRFLILNPKASIVLIANKTDLINASESAVPEKQLHKYFPDKSYPILLTSAKSGLMVHESFIRLAEAILE